MIFLIVVFLGCFDYVFFHVFSLSFFLTLSSGFDDDKFPPPPPEIGYFNQYNLQMLDRCTAVHTADLVGYDCIGPCVFKTSCERAIQFNQGLHAG